VAENLGQAQLELTVDLRAFEKGLDSAKKALSSLEAPALSAVKAGVQVATKELKNLTTAADRAEVKVRTLNQVLNDAPGAAYSKISAQIARLTSESRDLSYSSQQYLDVLQRISELEFLRSSRVGRQQAAAGAAAFSGPTLSTGFGANSNLPEIPLTLEGERQNIRELQQRLSNLNYESSEYAATLRVLERAQQRYKDIVSGTSSEYRKLEQQEERAIRRAEKLAGIQQYYADLNPRAGGVRDSSGAMLARGAGAASDERAYQAALRPSRELLENDLKRARALREITQRLQEASKGVGGFGAASAGNFGTTDPIQKAIRRNAEKRVRAEEVQQRQRDVLEADLASVTARRLKTETARAELADKLLAAERGSRSSGPGVLRTLGSPLQGLRPGAGLSSSLIGGAFPALFGQGAGASVGGALGGALGVFGGGFGFAGSLIGTAIGQQADNLTALAGALDAPIARFGELQQAGILSSRALEKNVEALINAGRYAEAEAKIREDLAKRGLDAATTTRLAQESDKLNRSLADLGVSIGLVVQGPIADLLNSFNNLLAPGRVAAQSRAIQDGLSPEDRQAYLARRRELISQGGQNILDINRQVNSEFGPRTQEALNAQKQITDAQREDNALLSAKYRLIDASTQGYERLTLEREKELLLEEKKAALRADPNNSLKTEQEAAERLYKINQQIARLDQKRFAENVAAANQIRSIQEDIALQQRRGGLTSLGIGALGSVKAFEDAKRAEQDAQAALRADPGNNNLINASQVAAENVRLAAAKTKADLIDAFKSAQDSVRAISRGIEDTVLQLQQLQNTSGGGLNEFMSAQQVSDRQAALAAELRPIAQEIANRRGLNFSLSGTNEDRNNAILRLIQADRQQTRLEQDLAQSRVDLGKAQNDLATINQSLVTVNTDLATATQALADKDWNVYVSVPGGSASGDVVREGVYQ
jgi:hypothetical protein